MVVAVHYVKWGYAQCHPARTLVSLAEEERATAQFPGMREVSFPARDGVSLQGWFVPPRNGVVVVMVHGLWANRATLAPEAEVFVRHGYGVLLYDSRAHGSSGGRVATWGSVEAFDVQEATRFVKAQPAVSHVALLGFSVGASAVTRAAANDPSAEAVILYATWTSLREETTYKESHHGWLAAQLTLLGFRISGVNIDDITPLKDLARIAPRPILMISGGLDFDTPPWVMDRMFARATSAQELWREPTVGHGGYYQASPAEYERHALGFLDSVFLSQGRALRH
jgi:dipeptidyl aminopeptidase/acylaminoacyl peptidase